MFCGLSGGSLRAGRLALGVSLGRTALVSVAVFLVQSRYRPVQPVSPLLPVLWRWEWRAALAGRFANGGLHRRWAAVATVLQSTVRPAIAGRGPPARGGSRAFLAALRHRRGVWQFPTVPPITTGLPQGPTGF